MIQEPLQSQSTKILNWFLQNTAEAVQPATIFIE